MNHLTNTTSPQVFTELAFYLWRVRFKQDEDWIPEVLFNGSDKALTTMHEAIKSMRDEFKINGQSTLKFLCNPPEDMDVVRYAKEEGAEIEWQIWLILRMEPDVPDDSRYEVKNKAVTLRLNDQMVNTFLQVLETHLDTVKVIEEGQLVPGGLLLAIDWLGFE